MTNHFTTTVIINATTPEVWDILTKPELMIQWLGEPEMQIKVHTDWKINSEIIISGFHNVKFENKGKVLAYEKEKRLCYSHLSSVSRLPDKAENYSVLEFILKPAGATTQLTLNIRNFPTESIRKHLEFYWRNTILVIKKEAENMRINSAFK